MNRHRMKFTLALAGLLLMSVGGGGRPSTARAAWRVSQFENVLGTSLELKFAGASDNQAARRIRRVGRDRTPRPHPERLRARERIQQMAQRAEAACARVSGT